MKWLIVCVLFISVVLVLLVELSYIFILVVKFVLDWLKKFLMVCFLFSVVIVILLVLVFSDILLFGLLLVLRDCKSWSVFMIDWLKGLLVVNRLRGEIMFDVGVFGNVSWLMLKVSCLFLK